MVITTNGRYSVMSASKICGAYGSPLISVFPTIRGPYLHLSGTPTFSSLSHFGDICEWMFYVHTFTLLRDVTIRDPAEAFRLCRREYIFLSPVTPPKL